MSVYIDIVDGPISDDARAPIAPGDGHVGASLTFDGIVRADEDGRSLVALDYQAYQPMATRQLTSIAEEIVRKHTLIGLVCWHSRGRVAVGQCSLRVIIHSAHRAESLAAMGEFINRLKQDVPIWKQPVFADDR